MPCHVIGGFLLALIMLFMGCDHVDLFGRLIVRISQPVGILVLVTSLPRCLVGDLPQRMVLVGELDAASLFSGLTRPPWIPLLQGCATSSVS
jgi:hypothetical protein